VAIQIRPAHHDDHGRLLEIWRAAVEASHHFLTPADVDWYESVVARYLPLMKDLRVAVERREVVGFIAQDDGEIHMLFVDPRAHGRGVGTALLNDVAGGHETLRLDVNEQNPSARSFYRAKGFVEIGRSDFDSEGRPFPLIHLRRSPRD
jgi:putative acetyltransferase